MTCIMSNFDVGTHGDSEGPIIRFGARMIITDSIIERGAARVRRRQAASPRTSAGKSKRSDPDTVCARPQRASRR